MANIFLWMYAYVVPVLLWHLYPCSASFEGSAFHLEAEGSTSSSSKIDSNIIDVQQSYIPARLIPQSQVTLSIPPIMGSFQIDYITGSGYKNKKRFFVLLQITLYCHHLDNLYT